MAIPRISYEGMDQTTKNAVLALQGYIAELESKLNNMNRATNTATSAAQDALNLSLGIDDIKFVEGFLINGQIAVSVASNNLTISLVTTSGTTPSTTDPIYVRLNGVIRTITSGLTVTLAAGTNWFNAGGSDFATVEKDYFVYLGYNATDGVVFGFCPTSYQNRYSEFSTTSTNERYLALTNRTSASATDYYYVIGRFAATLSAGAGYTWTVPTFTGTNLVQYPIWDSRWLSWTPTYSASGSMTYTSVSNDYVRYKLYKDICYIITRSTGTTGGTASTQILVTLPFFPSGSGGGNNTIPASTVNDNGLKSSGTVVQAGTLASGTFKYDNSNWSLGTGRQVYLNFYYSLI